MASLPAHAFTLYQADRLATYSERLIHGFTGKPLSLGGPGFSEGEIAENRQLFCRELDLPYENLRFPSQIHSDLHRLNLSGDTPCDAVIVTEPSIPAVVQVADCVPVLLYDPIRHAGAAIHAGWRGTAQQITAKVAQTLIEVHGCRANDLVAAIGPSIAGCCYEVSQEVVDAVSATVPNSQSSVYLQMNASGRPQIDLKTVNRLQLEALGILEVDVLPGCTRCEPDRLWSYRRGENGRQCGFLYLKPL